MKIQIDYKSITFRKILWQMFCRKLSRRMLIYLAAATLVSSILMTHPLRLVVAWLADSIFNVSYFERGSSNVITVAICIIALTFPLGFLLDCLLYTSDAADE